MSVSDHGNFDLAIEVTEELLAAVVRGIPPLPIPTAPIRMSLFTVRPQLTATVMTADCRSGATATVAVLGGLTGNLAVDEAVLPGPLPSDPPLRQIAIGGQFRVITSPVVGAVAGRNGVVLPLANAQVELTLDQGAVLSSFPVQAVLMSAYIRGGRPEYEQARADILGSIQGALTQALLQAISTLGNILAFPEPPGVSFRAVLISEVTLKVLITAVPPDGDSTLVSGLTVRRNSLGGPLDHCVVAISNAHILGSMIFPALTARLGIPGTRSRSEHPCLLVGPLALPPSTFGIPLLPGGAPAATVFVDSLMGQIDASGLRLDLLLRAVTWGSFATVTMRAAVRAPITAAIADGTLAITVGAVAATTSTDVAIDAVVYVVGFIAGGIPVLAVTIAVDLFTGGFIDVFIRDSVVPSLPDPLMTLNIPLTGSFAALTVNAVQTVEAAAPARSLGTVPLDRANDVFIRML